MEDMSSSNSLSSVNVVPLAPAIEVDQEVGRLGSVNTLMSNLTEVAAMSYGSGLGEGVKGGAGHIGVVNGKVVKFNTKSAERKSLNQTSDAFRQMMAASDALRERLAMSVSHIEEIVGQKSLFKGVSVDELAAFRTKAAALLGLETEKGQLKLGDVSFAGLANRGLLTRSAAAKTVTLIRDFLRQHVADRATVIKSGVSADPAQLDLSVWGKVKGMKNLASTSADSFAYMKSVGETLRNVALTKEAKLTVGDRTTTFAEHLRDCGNAVMKAAIAPIRLDDMSAVGQTTLTLKGKTYKDLETRRALDMVRYHRAETLAASLDAMLGRLHELYNAKRAADGKVPTEQPAIVSDLGANPVRTLLKQALGKVLGKTTAELEGLADTERFLTGNQNRNLMALVRNELLAVVAQRGNEFVPGSNPPAISEEAMLVKDFLMSAARLLDLDADGKDYSHVVKREETKAVRGDAKYESADAGKRLYTSDDYNVFTPESYGVNGQMKDLLAREAAAKKALQEALDGVRKDIFEPMGAFECEGREQPVSINIIPTRLRAGGEYRLNKYIEQLKTVDSSDANAIARMRRNFIDEISTVDVNAGIDTRRFTIKENGETKGVNYRTLVGKVLGDIFDRKLVPALVAVREEPADNGERLSVNGYGLPLI